jgi:lipopolysaccharide biosynthesis regulator YciM
MTTFAWIIVAVVVVAAAAGGVYYYYFRGPLRDKVSPDDSYVEALKALLDGNHTLAFLKLKETVTHDSNNIDAYLRLAALLRQRGMHAKALQLGTDLGIRQNVSAAERVRILYNLAEDHLVADNAESAEGIYRQLLQMSGQKPTATQKLVELYERTGRWNDAFKASQNYLDLTGNRDKSSLSKYKIKIATNLVSDGEFHKARVEFKEALKLDKKCVEAVVGLGDAYEKENRTEDAVKAWRQIIDVAPEKAELVFERLRKSLFDLGQFGEIEELYVKVLERDNDNVAALTGLANLSEKKGDPAHAEDTYHRILEIKPDYAPAIVGLLKLYREEKRFGDAAQVIDRTVDSLLAVDKS